LKRRVIYPHTLHIYRFLDLGFGAVLVPAVDEAVEVTLAARDVAFEVVLLPAADLTWSMFLFYNRVRVSIILIQ